MTDNSNNLESKVQDLTLQALVEKLAMLEYHNAQLSARLTVVNEQLKEYWDRENSQEASVKSSE